MKSAYIYVRVSTDEQKRKGYSLVEQEDRLIKHCEINNIHVKGIFREDFSAKNFNRPEWKKLIKTIKNKKHRSPENILFLKWDRFSRNIGYAYQMIGVLKDLNAQAMAIDQPIDFEVPESIVMLAVYLSIPEAENSRRGINASNGMRRARKMGRWPGKAPIGYINQTAPDGKKLIVPKQPEADYIKWSFQQFAKGSYSISQVRKMAGVNGFQCGRNSFWKLLHNPAYCGIVTVSANKNEAIQFVKAVHEPLISEDLFHHVQLLLMSNRKQRSTKQSLKQLFPLRGFLTCPFCNRKLTGSISQGKCSKYRYYHCSGIRCKGKGRFRADTLDKTYEEQLTKLHLVPEVYELFKLVLEDENILSARKDYMDEHKVILNEISKQQFLMSKARKFFLNEKIDFDDFSNLKKEYKET
ncbi:MAG TPA: recombinase family protein [Bacteroidia bacterium]|jgi:site-specific DNA recombinase|nr:recombinase family protein [Bacteroidia bacterium]